LFDEIEKAAPSLTRLLLGVLDRGVLRLGDNSVVNFEKSLVFLTSNLGAKEMMREISPAFGFASASGGGTREELTQKLQNIALVAVRKKFSPEFINRIDHVITYRPLDAESFSAITDHEIAGLQSHVNTRLGNRCFTIEVPFETRQWLIEHGTSAEYGARELKRTIHKNLTQPLATLVAKNQIEPGSRVRVEIEANQESLTLRAILNGEEPAPSHPTVLLVDDNRDLLQFLERLMAESGWELMAAESAGEARRMVAKRRPNAALLDYMLPDGNGVELAQQLKQIAPNLQIIMMTGSMLAPEEEAICEEHDFPVLRKPFLAADVMNQIRGRLANRAAGGR
jgi:CheY-like chemotaxis protein